MAAGSEYIFGRNAGSKSRYKKLVPPTAGDFVDIFSYIMSAPSPGIEKFIRALDFSAIQLLHIDASKEAQMTIGTKGVTINIEGWQLILAVLAVLAGPYIYSWDAFNKVGDSIDDLRVQSSKDISELNKTLRDEMRLNRKESTEQFELLRKDMSEDRRTSTNAILDLQKQQGQLRP